MPYIAGYASFPHRPRTKFRVVLSLLSDEGSFPVDADLAPLPLSHQLLLFGLPGVSVFVGTWFLVPPLVAAGMPYAVAFLLTTLGPLLPLLPLAFVLYRRDGGAMTWPAIRDRFRLQRPRARDFLWIIGGVVAVLVSEELLKPTSALLAQVPVLAPPAHFPRLFDPTSEVVLPLQEFFGVSLSGNWTVLAVVVPFHFFSMSAEEVMWRGYILPRQEVSYGRWAWVINGLFWAYLVHMLLPWSFIGFLPSMLITPYLAQRCRNTWVSLGVHGLGNAPVWGLLLHGILAG